VREEETDLRPDPSHTFLSWESPTRALRVCVVARALTNIWVFVCSSWNSTMLGFLPPLRLSRFSVPSNDSTTSLPPLEKLAIRSQDRLSVWGEGSKFESEETKGQQSATEGMVGRRRTVIDTQKAEISMLSNLKERYQRKHRAAKERIAELEHRLGEDSRTYKRVVEERDQRIKTLEVELTRTKELLAARIVTPERSRAQPSTDRLSETEVLGIVRDLNENIFQVAANLTEEWEAFKSSRSDSITPTKDDANSFSQSYGPTLINQVLDQKPTAVTFLVQSFLCELATQITSSWLQNEELRILRSVYQNLPPTGKNTSV
jgi:hypothetical protein